MTAEYSRGTYLFAREDKYVENNSSFNCSFIFMTTCFRCALKHVVLNMKEQLIVLFTFKKGLEACSKNASDVILLCYRSASDMLQNMYS
jgi:hypothetical protein